MLFFAVPWELLPQGVRRFVSDFTLSEHDTICSRVIDEAFESVNYPIRPTYIEYGQGLLSKEALRYTKGIRHRGKGEREKKKKEKERVREENTYQRA